MTYRLLPHTADVMAALDAATLAGLYQDGVDLVRGLLVGDGAVEARLEVVIPPEGLDESERFFRFVRELLYLYDVERFLPLRVAGTDPPTVVGEPFDAARHAPECQVKAVTRHRYTFTRGPAGYHVEVVFDL